MGLAARDAAAVLREHADRIVDLTLVRERSRWPDLFASFDDRQLGQTRADTRFHVDFLSSSLWADEPPLFTEYARWVKTLFAGIDLPLDWFRGSLLDLDEGITDAVGHPVLPAQELIRATAASLDDLDIEVPSYIDQEQALGGLAVRYLGAVLGANRRAASQMVLEAADSGVGVAQIYTEVFQRVQLELGRLWHSNHITVAQEHYATAVTQLVMSQLYDRIFSTEKNGRTLVAACIGGELHEMGMRMVADFFEMAHWDTYYLGANSPAGAIVQAAAENHADIVALAATMSFNVPGLEQVIEALRADDRTKNMKIIVGGYPFNLAPELWKRVGADGFAPDAETAIRLAERLLVA